MALESQYNRDYNFHSGETSGGHSSSALDGLRLAYNEDSDEEEEDSDFDIENEQRVVFNVGGFHFETLKRSLDSPKHLVPKLLDKNFLHQHWDAEREQYFFDRDPAGFQVVLNYVRTGSLHLPCTLCSPQITEELGYWGLPCIDIEPCCWTEYSMGLDELEKLRKLEEDRKNLYDDPESSIADGPLTWKGWIKNSVWAIVSNPSSGKLAKVFFWMSLIIVFISILSFCLATLPSIREGSSETAGYIKTVLNTIDKCSFFYFIIEYVMGVASCPDRKAYIFSIHSLIDCLCNVFDLGSMITDVMEDSESQTFINFFRCLRAFRVFRLFRRVKPLWIIVYTLRASAKDVGFMLILLYLTVVVFGALMHKFDDQEVFTSVPAGFWWSITTMTTVGYGDQVPVTAVGKVLGCLAAFVGLLVLGLTIPALAHNFTSFTNYFDMFTQKKKEQRKHALSTMLLERNAPDGPMPNASRAISSEVVIFQD